MKMTRKMPIKPLKLQRGMTLIELLVAGIVSLIAVSGMVLVMASTLGTSTQTIEMSRLNHDMRTAMQIMTRELRRANYHSGWINCYGNTDCRADLNVDGVIGSINIDDSADTDDCVWFWYDRPQICPTTTCTATQLAAAQTSVTGETVSAFRRTVANGIGKLQMTTTTTTATAASCTSGDDWVDITDPNVMNVLSFTVSNTESIEETINLVKLHTEKIGLTMTAKLTGDPSVPTWIRDKNNEGATRRLDDFVKVRNNFTAP